MMVVLVSITKTFASKSKCYKVLIFIEKVKVKVSTLFWYEWKEVQNHLR